MNGFNIAEAGHSVNLLPAVSISGGKTSQAFSMKGAEHVSILISFGVMGALVPTSIIVNQCSSAAGAGATAMPFRYYNQPGGAGNDVPSAYTYATAAGITAFPVSVANYTYFIEVDAAELEDIGLPYLQVVIADSGNVTYAQITAVLSALRNSYQKSSSVTV